MLDFLKKCHNKPDLDMYSTIRSDEVQEIMGQIPHWIVRWGITLIVIILILMIIGSYFFQYPDKMSASVVIRPSKHPIAEAQFPAYGIGDLKVGHECIIKLQNYPDTKYGFIKGNVINISGIPNKDLDFSVLISINDDLITSEGYHLPHTMQMVGNVDVIIKRQRLIEKLILPIKSLIK